MSDDDHHHHNDVIVIGGGIVGLATAAALLHRGVKNIRVYEKARRLHPLGAAIGLFPNGFCALREISPTVEKRVRESCIPNSRSTILDLDGNVLRNVDFSKMANVSPNYLVWYLLQQYLMGELDENVLQLGHVFESFNENQETGLVTVQVRNRDKNTVETKTCRVLVGGDGIQSAVRSQMVGAYRELRYHNKMMFRAVMPLSELDDGVCPPAGVSVAYQGDVKGKLFAFRETAPGIVTLTAMAVFEEPLELLESQAKKERLQSLFDGYPKDVMHVLDRVSADAIHETAVYDIEVEPQWSKGGCVVIVGDAAHAMTPGLGQGANQGLEDACEVAYRLANVLLENKNNETIPEALESFWSVRMDRVKSVHAASCERTGQVNQSDKNSRLDVLRRNDPSLFDEIYKWQPSYAKKKEAAES